MTRYLFFFLFSIANSFSQRYFIENFNYKSFAEIDSLNQAESKNAIWTTKHAARVIDINQNKKIDSEEIFKNTTIVKDPFRKGNKVLRIELNKVAPKFFSKYACDDSNVQNEFSDEKLNELFSPSKNLYCVGCKKSPLGIYRYEWLTHMTRNEIATKGPEKKLFKTKKHQWFGVEILIDELYELDNLENEEIITQFYNVNETSLHPILSLRIVDKKYWMYIYRVESKTPERIYLANVEKNKWVSWKYHFRISKNPKKSIIEIWKDNLLVLEKRGVVVPNNQRYYLKVGVYKWGWWDCGMPILNSKKKVLFFDKIWTNRNDISTRVNHK
ncbi:MAG: heparin lyase I family protein [Patiriisocius sp.]|uniref:heparin lyase I family protein n=1 Tax=Patiriisocius sp. TaxID=2822396 RepID=UPI003EFAB8B6